LGQRLDAVEAVLGDASTSLHEGLHRILSGFVDVERITARIALKSARPRDLSGLRETLSALPRLQEAIGSARNGRFEALVRDLAPQPEAAALLRAALLPEPAASVRDGGVINDGFDAELDELRAIQTDSAQFLIALETRERARSGIANLKVEYNRVHGFYIEVTRAQSEKVPDDYRRRQTLKNAERYITPELKAFEDKALSAQERALAREKLLYESVLDALRPHIPALQRCAAALAEIDALASFAERAGALGWSAPELVDDAVLEIEAGRHPVVEAQVDSF